MEYLLNLYATIPRHKMLIVDMSYVTMVDLSGVYGLEDMINGCKSNGVKVVVSSVPGKIKEILKKVNFIDHIGPDCYKDSKSDVISIISKDYNLK